jgi:rod shape determining protein RodA
MTLLARDPRAPFELPLGAPAQRRRAGYDWWLFLAAAALALIGALLIWSATRDLMQARGEDPQSYLYRHLFNVAIAVGLTILAARVDARLMRLIGPVIYLASVAGLLLVFAIGHTVNGAHSWIHVAGSFEVQPSEFMKLGMIVGMAVLLAQRAAERADGRTPTTGDVLLALALVAIPVALILAEPDLGSAMVLAAAAFGVLVAAGIPARWIVALLVLGVLVTLIALHADLLHDYQLARFKSFTDPAHDPQGAAYNVLQARIAVAGGGLFGTGMFRGPQTSGGFVPEQQTDFVFSVAGEQFGLVGGCVVIGLFALLCWRGLRIARQADHAGRLIAVGVVCWFGFQAFQNIGMNLGLTPVTGIPLPFVSYGGSSMFAQALAIGLVQAVHRRGPAPDALR